MSEKPFDMPARGGWEERGGWVVNRLAADLGISQVQAAGLVGNLGFESAALTKLHEIGQPEGVGGYGWGQWTAGRRETFLAFAEAAGLDWQSDAANYGYLLHELQTTQRHTISALRQCSVLEQAVFSVGQTFERPGGTTATHLPGYDGRLDYAERALAGARAAPASGDAGSQAAPAPGQPVADPPPEPRVLRLTDPPMHGDDVRALQTALAAASFDPGEADGIFGAATEGAIFEFQAARGIEKDGIAGPATQAALAK